jgi:hypothetical protein
MKTKPQYTVIDESTVIALANNPHIKADEYKNFTYYSDDVYPAELIDKVRPNEHTIVKKYREETYEPVFSEVFERLLNAINRIQRADDYVLKYPEIGETDFSRISRDELLKEYFTNHFTASNSLMNWAFSVCLKQYVIDSNAVVIIWSELPETTTDYRKPKPYIINSDRILYSYENKSVVYFDEDDKNIIYSVDAIAWSKWEKKRRGNGWQLIESVEHNLGKFPGFTMGGVVTKETEIGRVYTSRFKGMLPWLNTATTEFSDLRAEVIQHIHSTVWIYQDEPCGTCSGTGYLIKQNEKVPCTNSKCKNGQIPTSPYDVIRIRPAKTTMGEVPAPTPPMGYVQKQTEIAELQDRRINEMRYRALAAVNMQFMEQPPAQQSGIAKAYDREETNNTLYGVAVDMAYIMEKIAYLCAKWRYHELYSDEEIKEMCPVVLVPNTFDILGSQSTLEEIKMLKDSGLNDRVLSEKELEYIRMEFPDQIELQNQMQDAFELDAGSGYTVDEISALVSNRMMSKHDAVIHTYITEFIQRAYDENAEFHGLDRKAKQSILMAYADEKIKEISAKEQIQRNL